MSHVRSAAATAALALGVLLVSQGTRHLNPVVDLLAAREPVFGVYGPRNPRAFVRWCQRWPLQYMSRETFGRKSGPT